MGAAILELLARRVLKGKSSKTKAPIGFLISDSGEVGNMRTFWVEGRSGDLADLRFPRKGCANPRGRGAKLLYGKIFAEHKKERKWNEGAHTPSAPSFGSAAMLQASLLLNPPIYYI